MPRPATNPIAPPRLRALALLLGGALAGPACHTEPPIAPLGEDAGALDAAAPDLAPPRLLDLGPPPDLRAPYTGPQTLSATGLYADLAARTLAADVLEFRPRYELWSDGSDKSRYLRVPPGATIDTTDMDHWVFPVGTKLWKEFRRGGHPIETRLLEKTAAREDGWLQVAFLWRADGSDADAAPGGAVDALGTSHDVPAQDDCAACHIPQLDAPLGIGAIQSSGPHGDLARLLGAGLLAPAPASEFNPPGAPTTRDALGYLHANCGHCHNDAWGLASQVKLRLQLRVADQTPEATPTYKTAINVRMNHDLPRGVRLGVVPGDPDQSQLWRRMDLRGLTGMPPLATEEPDRAGLALVEQWIRALPPAP